MTQKGQPLIKVGFIPETKIEQAACNLIARYTQRFGLAADEPVPVEPILESLLGLIFEVEDLSEYNCPSDTLGATWASDKVVRVDESLDPTLYPKREGRYNFTIAHELGHWELHRQLLIDNESQVSMFGNRKMPSHICRASTRRDPIEFQADMFASFLLLPKDRVLNSWKKMHGELKPYYAKDEIQDLKDMWDDDFPVVTVAKDLAQQFKVSGQAMQIRLQKLGLILTKRPEPDLFS